MLNAARVPVGNARRLAIPKCDVSREESAVSLPATIRFLADEAGSE
jgi:hypothetical protein